MTPRNRHALTKSHAELQRGHRPENSNCNTGQELIAEVKAWALNWSTELGLDIAESEPWSDEENY